MDASACCTQNANKGKTKHVTVMSRATMIFDLVFNLKHVISNGVTLSNIQARGAWLDPSLPDPCWAPPRPEHGGSAPRDYGHAQQALATSLCAQY
jgi:hypothetical protein